MGKIEQYFIQKDNANLITALLKLDLFPIKDSYVAYLKRDKSSIIRNPETINRLAGRLYDMGLEKSENDAVSPKKQIVKLGLCLNDG